MRSPRRRRLLLVLLLGLLTSAVLSGTASATDGPDIDHDDREPPDISLRLSPAVIEVPYEDGPFQHQLRVDNLGSRPLQVTTQFEEFTVTEDGTTLFLGPDHVSAASWASLDVDAFELAPSQRRDVVLTVEVPDDAEPGERYLSVIFVVPGEADGDGNITVTHRVAVKLYIAVPGERNEAIELGELSGPRLIDGRRAAFQLIVHNGGNVHRRFEASNGLLATNGDAAFPFENFTILRDSTRVVEAIWPDPPLLCWCTVEVEIDDGHGNLLIASTRVIAFPLRLSLALVVLIAGLAVFTVGRRRGRTARLERKLATTSRGRGAPPPPGGHAASVPTDPPPIPLQRHDAPAVQPAQLVTIPTSSPVAPAATTNAPTPRSAPPEPEPGAPRLFTAHGTPDRPPRRRRRGH